MVGRLEAAIRVLADDGEDASGRIFSSDWADEIVRPNTTEKDDDPVCRPQRSRNDAAADALRHITLDMLAAAGLTHPEELGPHHLVRRVSATEIRLFSDLHVFLQPGELLTGLCEHAFYRRNWELARTDSFDRMA